MLTIEVYVLTIAYYSTSTPNFLAFLLAFCMFGALTIWRGDDAALPLYSVRGCAASMTSFGQFPVVRVIE